MRNGAGAARSDPEPSSPRSCSKPKAVVKRKDAVLEEPKSKNAWKVVGKEKKEVGPQLISSFSSKAKPNRPNTSSDLPIAKSPLATKNRFLILGNQNEDVDCEFTLIGDSIIRDQENLFCNGGRKTRRRFCIPGGTVENIISVTQSIGENRGSLIVNVGTNDIVLKPKVRGARPEVNRNSVTLFNNFKKLVSELGNRKNKSIIVGILPRMRVNREISSRMIGVNERVKVLCHKHNVAFLDMWDSFSQANSLFKDDGLHLSLRGSRRYANLLEQGLIGLGF
jgi:hypothetical protein